MTCNLTMIFYDTKIYMFLAYLAIISIQFFENSKPYIKLKFILSVMT